LQEDPDEVNNLARSPQHRDIWVRMVTVHFEHSRKIRDLGFLPEGEIHSRSEGSTPYEVGLKYPLELIWPVAQVASFRRPPETLVSGFLENLKKRLQHEDSAVRYWAALGLLRFSKDGVEAAKDDLHRSLADASAHVRIVAAEALGRYGNEEDLKKS